MAAGLAGACGDAGPAARPFEWPVATPQEAGLDTAALAAMVAHIEADLPNLNAVVVVRDGRVAFEWYHAGVAPESVFDVHSVTKSFVSAFVGIALARGWIDSLDQPIREVFSDVLDAGADPRARRITVRHLLTMSSGLAVESDPAAYSLDSLDAVGRMLRSPLAFEPGTEFRYDGGNPHLLSALIGRGAGRNLAALAGEGLFERLNVGEARWVVDADLVNNGGTGLWLAARDMAKLGELYRLDGTWQGERLLPAGWARQVAGTVSFRLPQSFADYGMLWWTTARYGPDMWIAAGFRQQYVVVLPELAMVVAIQSESYAPRGPVREHFHLLTEYLVPAVVP